MITINIDRKEGGRDHVCLLTMDCDIILCGPNICIKKGCVNLLKMRSMLRGLVQSTKLGRTTHCAPDPVAKKGIKEEECVPQQKGGGSVGG